MKSSLKYVILWLIVIIIFGFILGITVKKDIEGGNNANITTDDIVTDYYEDDLTVGVSII